MYNSQRRGGNRQSRHHDGHGGNSHTVRRFHDEPRRTRGGSPRMLPAMATIDPASS